MERTELQRIAHLLKIDVNEENLCLLIQDKIKENYREVKKKKFCNTMLIEKLKIKDKEIHNLHNEYAENIGIQEYMMLKNSYNNLKKNYSDALKTNNELRNSIEQYREREFKDRLKKIEGVR